MDAYAHKQIMDKYTHNRWTDTQTKSTGTQQPTPITKGMGAVTYSSMSEGSRGMNTCCQAKGYSMAEAAWTQDDSVRTSSATSTILLSHSIADHSRRKFLGAKRT